MQRNPKSFVVAVWEQRTHFLKAKEAEDIFALQAYQETGGHSKTPSVAFVFPVIHCSSTT